MLTKLEIENFKSIHKESIDLGRVNIFIGENGCGKTNILEGLGMASAVKSKKLKNDELVSKGIRVTKPDITFSSFKSEKQKDEILIGCTFDDIELVSKITIDEKNEIHSEWIDSGDNVVGHPKVASLLNEAKRKDLDKMASAKALVELINALDPDFKNVDKGNLTDYFLNFSISDILLKKAEQYNLTDYRIFSLSTRILRGIGGHSFEVPGLHGEHLDYLINSFSKAEMEELEEYASMISWLDEIIIDQDDSLKLQGHKLNLSSSKLYFRDKFMQKKNNVFSAENANEGILHILFYIALFISKKTPKLFAIDNIETALNPGLCRNLIEILVKLAKKHDKQVLITTHNPAILDGINLHDDEQRIFTVARNFKGHTKVKRLQIKPEKEVGGHKLKLSELWMRNYLGAIPQHI